MVLPICAAGRVLSSGFGAMRCLAKAEIHGEDKSLLSSPIVAAAWHESLASVTR